MKSFVSVLLAAVAFADIYEESFLQYITKYGKSYTNLSEFNYRMALFKATDQFINDHNSLLGSGYRLGHNKFSDYSQAERDAMNTAIADSPRQAAKFINLRSAPLPVDWRV